MTGFNPIDIHIAVGKYGTAYRTDGNGVFLHAHLLDDFSHQFMNYTMAATRAVVHRRLVHQRWFAVDSIFGYNKFFACHKDPLPAPLERGE